MEEKFLTNKTVLISGASRGIGAEIAMLAAEHGAKLILCARSEDSLESIKSRVGTALVGTALVGTALVGTLPVDFSIQNDIDLLRERLLPFGAIDFVVNNAGIARFKPMKVFTADDYNDIFNVNVFGPFSLIKAVLPEMLERESGAIININSVASIKTFPYNSLYAASKSAFLTMSRVLRAETSKKGIKVIDVLPGATETEIWSPENREKLRASMMQPLDVASVVLDAMRSALNPRLHVEEIIVRPQCGDF